LNSSNVNADKLKSLQIDRAQKARPRGMLWAIFLGVLAITLVAVYFAWPKASDKIRLLKNSTNPTASASASVDDANATSTSASAKGTNASQTKNSDTVLTVSGYIINRERIEISPRFMGVVKWIGVKKGDAVTNGQVVVLLDDTEFKARLAQADGTVATAKANMDKAQVTFDRVNRLAATDVESKQAQDDARLALEAAKATLKEAEGARQVAQTYLDWCTIRSPINGVVMEKLVDPNELVTPQSYGGTRGPSTALIAVADPKDLQVEIDVNESDLSKISLNQKCRVSPEAYPDKIYGGYVAEIAPEADRAKGTLEIKVQIVNPDKFLTPELSARVDFLKK
jgi:HlyD family secretion protein